ncbi:MAG: leucyl/phenylalanyl-tRNA--protein transferase [Deltaproteobacteria bacterium]|jgi:leucyl/phenylalanyl-tRNA--protein transferase|nr:leucyl/phenylalanyl-tRNA--protein transferase [Deltaproteobacteria bacterium]
MAVYRIPEDRIWFPPLEEAEPDGLLGVGGDLSPQRLLTAYALGIFPWYAEEDGPILWWSPDPRAVLPLDAVHAPRSLQRALRRRPFRCTLNHAFGEVIRGCAGPRPGQGGTWLGGAMIEAYEDLHRLGYALSVEAWREGALAGGIYGVALGRAFFGESMFYRIPDASKAALLCLADYLRVRGCMLFDCQQNTAHMRRFGAVEIPRAEFARRLREALAAR